MSGKSQTNGDFTFCRPSQILPIYRIIARSLPRFSRDATFICVRGTGAQQFRGLVMSEIHRRRPRRYKCEFSFVGNDRWNLRRVGKIETLPILQICPRPSQTIGDIYDFEFSLLGKIWDSRETVKSPIVWDFPDIWKPGFTSFFYTTCLPGRYGYPSARVTLPEC